MGRSVARNRSRQRRGVRSLIRKPVLENIRWPVTTPLRQLATVSSNVEMVGKTNEFMQGVRLLMLHRNDAWREAEARRMPDRVVEFCKSAATAGSTVVGNWANPLAPFQNLSTAWLASLSAISVFDALWPSMIQCPPRSTILAVSSSLTGAAIAEGNAKAAGRISLTGSDLDTTKAVAFCAISSELLRSGSPNAISILQTELRIAIARASNSIFLPLLVAGTSVASSGLLASAVRQDLRTLLSLVSSGADSKLYFITTRTIVEALCVLPDTTGAGAFPGVTANGGSIAGIPVVPCDECTSGEILLCDSSQICAASEGLRLDASNEAMIEFAAPPDSPVSASTFQTSLFQMNLTALKAERLIGAKVLRSDAVAKITGVAYTGGSPA
jgi:Phage capsid family